MPGKLQLVENGIICDNPNCDWHDPTVTAEETPGWLNKPCPKCGENLLTQEDLDNWLLVMAAALYMNSMTEEEHAELAKKAKEAFPEILESDFLKDTVGKEILLDPEAKNVVMRVDTHKGLKAKEIFTRG